MSGSLISQENKTPVNKQLRIYQNSYRMYPQKPFDEIKVKIIMKNIIDTNLQEIEYSEHAMKDLCLQFAGEIRNAVKDERYDRCRLIITVVIGQKKMQGVDIAHSFIWDKEKDKYAEYSFENSNFFVQAIVYGIYYE